MKINLLDCTLREAPVKDLMFGKDIIQKFISKLEHANTDIIECGFLRDAGACENNTIFLNTDEIEPFLINKQSDKIYTVLIDYGRYNVEKLFQYNGKSVDGIRICFKKHEKDDVLEFAKHVKDKGYKVFIQQVDTSGYSDNEIIEFIDCVNALKPYAYSIVDTFGSMYPKDVEHLLKLVDTYLDKNIIMGFHAHNNLMLAAANSQLFIENLFDKRTIITDAAVLGCGRGAGNTNTELLMQFINTFYSGNYNLDAIFDIADDLMPKIHAHWGYSLPYFVSGTHSTHVFNINYLLEKHNISSKNLKNFIETLNESQKKYYNYDLLEKLYHNYCKGN